MLLVKENILFLFQKKWRNAQIPKEYRERKKAKDAEKYLREERERHKRNYVPSALLSKKARDERNKKTGRQSEDLDLQLKTNWFMRLIPVVMKTLVNQLHFWFK